MLITDVMSGLTALKELILTSKTGIAVEEKNIWKMQDWSDYLIKRGIIGLDIRKSTSTSHLKTLRMIQTQGVWSRTN